MHSRRLIILTIFSFLFSHVISESFYFNDRDISFLFHILFTSLSKVDDLILKSVLLGCESFSDLRKDVTNLFRLVFYVGGVTVKKKKSICILSWKINITSCHCSLFVMILRSYHTATLFLHPFFFSILEFSARLSLFVFLRWHLVFCLLPLIKNTVYCCLWGSHAQGEGICTVDTHFCRQWSRRHCRAYDLRHFHVSGFERFRHFFHTQNLRFPISKSTNNRGCHVLHRGNLPHTCYSDKPH